MPSTTRGSILLSTAENVGAMLKKKLSSPTGFSPSEWAQTINLLGKLPEKSVSGALAHFTDGANDVPIKSGVFNIAYNSNGLSSMVITRCGKNLFPTSLPSNVINATINSNGSITSATNARTFAIELKKNTNITYTCSSRQAWTVGVSNDLPVVGGTCTFLATLTSRDSYSFSTGENIYLLITVNSETAFNDAPSNHIMFELGTTATAYEAYQGMTYPVSFGTTIYGGYFESETGVLTSTKASDGTDLVPPVEYQLTPVEINTLKGDNNIFSDSGDAAIEYRADIDLLIYSLGG